MKRLIFASVSILLMAAAFAPVANARVWDNLDRECVPVVDCGTH